MAKVRSALAQLDDILHQAGWGVCICFVCKHQESFGPCDKCRCKNELASRRARRDEENGNGD